MTSGVTPSVSPSHFSILHSKPKITHFSSPSNLKFRPISPIGSPRFVVRCSSGDGDSRTVLNAFFLGKALAEALTERVESTIGEVLSGIGRLQAEQQKQILDFQEEVLERAKKAQEKAARDAKEVQGPISSSSSIRSPTIEVASSSTSSTNQQQLSNPSSDSGTAPNQDPPLGGEE
ncbi:putative protein, chloroplastic [Cucurbita argyrosperma subsp. argyrosperma]